MTDEERAEFQQKVRPVRLCLTKIRKFASKVVNSSTILLPAYKKRVAELKMPDRVIPHDVATRWNSTYDMLTAALEYRKVVDAMCADRELGLRKYELGAPVHQRTDTVDCLHVCSPAAPLVVAPQIFKDATYFFSRGTPNLATVIPAMDLIDQRLATKHLQSAKYDFSIRTAMGLAKKTLNKYYELTDASEAYRITMSTFINLLHPSYKKAYFEKAGWLAEWTDVAEGLSGLASCTQYCMEARIHVRICYDWVAGLEFLFAPHANLVYSLLSDHHHQWLQPSSASRLRTGRNKRGRPLAFILDYRRIVADARTSSWSSPGAMLRAGACPKIHAMYGEGCELDESWQLVRSSISRFASYRSNPG
ncbi:hypothetical protein NUW54_g10786 [Trametes sanguinea]|uniref:Uncharacterized protein n=1 Tax=Trametes sanguinea TaxID=158606 RepID=A0ACC1NTD8_9APHY|nr:hypothetical protein NUW54_g10786 [Trametes sanguinea]